MTAATIALGLAIGCTKETTEVKVMNPTPQAPAQAAPTYQQAPPVQYVVPAPSPTYIVPAPAPAPAPTETKTKVDVNVKTETPPAK